MLGFDAFGALAFGETPDGDARVPVVHGDQAHFAFGGTPYTYATDFSWQVSAYVAGVGATTLGLTAEAVGSFQNTTIHAQGAVALDATPDAEAGHGVAGAAAAALDAEPVGSAAHGVSGTSAAALDAQALASAAHGVSATAAAGLDCAPTAQATHLRYELRGEVRLGGVLVNRRVRAYLRSTGALVGEVDTTAGRFSIHAGFAEAEHYVVPIHLDDAAEDWAPPVANRVLSVLAQDVA